MKGKLLSSVAFSIFLIILCHCRGPNEPLPLRAPEMGAPIIKGLFITNEYSPDPVAVWGDPILSEESDLMDLYTPYPNPSNGNSTIPFRISKTMHVRLYAVEAVYDGERNAITTSSNGVFQSIGGMAAIMFIDEELQAGWYNTYFSLDGENANLPSGFYRIYLQGEDVLLWQDVFIFRDTEEDPLPAEFRSAFGQYLGESW